MYKLEYLPIAKQDMIEIAEYISHELCNPEAAEKLSEDMVNAADGLVDFPYANAIHITVKPLNREYRKLIVKNYIMFYWIDEINKLITIARVIYAPVNMKNYYNLFHVGTQACQYSAKKA